LHLVLLYSQKPIVTGAFSINTLQTMIDNEVLRLRYYSRRD
ncbi:MAG: hypothetical protein RL095_4222, partial [Verrucomicrobiota bacterium]